MTIKEKIEQLKVERLAELKGSDLSKYEQLEAIFEEDLMQVGRWIAHLFEKEVKQINTQEKKDGESVSIVDDYIGIKMGDGDGWDRRQIVSFASIIEMMKWEAKENNGQVEVAQSRRTYDYDKKCAVTPRRVLIPLEQAIDSVYDYAIENNQSGFIVDW